MKNKGFTLVELLAIIIVLGVITSITISVVTMNIENTRESSFEVSVKNLLDASKEFVTKNMENHDFPKEGISANLKELGIENNPFISGIIKRNENGQIELVDVTDGTYCVNGTKTNLTITKDDCSKDDETKAELKLKVLDVKTTEAKIMIKTYDGSSGIDKYKYCLYNEENKECKEVEKNGERTLVKEIIKLENLNVKTKYKLEVEVINGSSNETIKVSKEEIEFETKEIEEPTFKLSSNTYATEKELIITYPEVEEGYEYKYKTINSEEKIETAENKEVKIKIDSAMKVIAYIEKDNEVIVENSVIIEGIDLEPPIVNVLVPDIDSWTKTKIVEIVANDTGVGLALRPYSYDNGETWVKGKEKEITTSMVLDLKSRDRLGNTTDEFTLNGEECFLDGKNLCYINKVDGLAPDIEIEVIGGTRTKISGYTDWYNSDEVKIRVTITEYFTKNYKKELGGSGLSSVKINVNGSVLKNEKLNNVQNKTYEFTLNESGQNKIEVIAIDAVGNQNTKYNIIKIDNIMPIVSIKNNPLNLDDKDYNFVNNINVLYGPTGGKVTCNPSTSLKMGTYLVTCSVQANNEKIVNGTSFEVQHSYRANVIDKTCQKNCKTKKVCTCGEEKCDPWECPDGVDWPSASCRQYFGATCCKCSLTKKTICDEYPCPEYDCYKGGSNDKCPAGTPRDICCY